MSRRRLTETTFTFYPMTMCYIGAAVAMSAAAQGWINTITALASITLVCVIVLILAVRREVHTVHVLVNSQRDLLLDRIDQLVRTLNRSGIATPPEPERGSYEPTAADNPQPHTRPHDDPQDR